MEVTPIADISPPERQQVVAQQRWIRGLGAGLSFEWNYDWGQGPPGSTLLVQAGDTDSVDVITMPDNTEIAAGAAGAFSEDRVAVMVYSPDGHPSTPPGLAPGTPLPPEGV